MESLRRNDEIPDGAGLLQIDTEGFDLEVMRGMGDGHFSVVMSEFWDSAHPFGRLATNRLEDLVREMKCRGYDWYIVIYHLDESSTISYNIREPSSKIQELLRMFAIEDLKGKPVSRLSSGENTRVGFCKALLNDPKLLLMDEPTAYLSA